MENETTVSEETTPDYSDLSVEKYQEESLKKQDEMLQKQDEILQKQDDALKKQDDALKKHDESIQKYEDIKSQNDEVINLLKEINKGISEGNENTTTTSTTAETQDDYLSKIYNQQQMQSWILLVLIGLTLGYIAIRGVFDNWRT